MGFPAPPTNKTMGVACVDMALIGMDGAVFPNTRSKSSEGTVKVPAALMDIIGMEYNAPRFNRIQDAQMATTGLEFAVFQILGTTAPISGRIPTIIFLARSVITGMDTNALSSTTTEMGNPATTTTTGTVSAVCKEAIAGFQIALKDSTGMEQPVPPFIAESALNIAVEAINGEDLHVLVLLFMEADRVEYLTVVLLEMSMGCLFLMFLRVLELLETHFLSPMFRIRLELCQTLSHNRMFQIKLAPLQFQLDCLSLMCQLVFWSLHHLMEQLGNCMGQIFRSDKFNLREL